MRDLARRRGARSATGLGAAQRADHAGQHDRQPVAAGIDDPGLAQHRQQVRAALDRLLAGVERPLHHLGGERVLHLVGGVGAEPRLLHVRELGRDPAGHLAHDREDRALRRVAHRAVGLVGGTRQRRADQHRIDQLAGAADQLLGGAADQLREDHAGVAAGAEQRRARDRADDLLAPDLIERALLGGLEDAIELLEHRAQREHHVVARVAVGDREDVEVIDLLPPLFERGKTSLHERAEAKDRGIAHGRARLTSLGDLAGLEAARADVHATRRAAVVDPDALEVRIKAAIGGNHRVAAGVAEGRTLGADVTDL